MAPWIVHPNGKPGRAAVGLPVRRDLTILIVEDLENDAVLLQMALKRAGIKDHVKVVDDGEEAIAYLHAKGKYRDRAKFPFPDVLFTDLKMPRMSGFEVLEWLRSHRECSIIPIIVMSASRLEEDVRKAYELGANAYLAKPGRLEELQNIIKVAFEFWALCEKPAPLVQS